jgi:hypothetical protein
MLEGANLSAGAILDLGPGLRRVSGMNERV